MDVLREHLKYMTPLNYVGIAGVLAGDVIKFTYQGEPRTVFVLNPRWKNQLHGLTLNHIARPVFLDRVLSHWDNGKNPQDFYSRYINQPAIVQLDCYRRYVIKQINAIQRMNYELTEKIAEEIVENIERVEE